MFRLKANKTSLYKLVGEFEDLPPMRRVTITKAYRAPDWWLKWTDADGLLCVAFFSTCMGKALLSIDKKEFCGPQVSRVVHDLDTKDLLERGMVEKFTTAAERGGCLWRGVNFAARKSTGSPAWRASRSQWTRIPFS